MCKLPLVERILRQWAISFISRWTLYDTKIATAAGIGFFDGCLIVVKQKRSRKKTSGSNLKHTFCKF